MKTTKILLALATITALSCSAPKPKETAFDSKFNELSTKMTTDDVKKLLGPPSLRELKNGIELWHYENIGDGSKAKYVQFMSGHVSGFAQEQSELISDKTSLPSTNKEIGQVCKDDVECQSNNCHFGRCSGKDNCNVGLGKVCATNNECCSHFCDFGICRNPR